MSDDIKPGEKVLVEGRAINVDAKFCLIQFDDSNDDARCWVPSGHTHRASDLLRPKFRVKQEVFAPDGLKYRIRSMRIECQTETLEGDASMWIDESNLHPAPAKTPLDEARERLERATYADDMLLDDVRLVLARLADLERRER